MARKSQSLAANLRSFMRWRSAQDMSCRAASWRIASTAGRKKSRAMRWKYISISSVPNSGGTASKRCAERVTGLHDHDRVADPPVCPRGRHDHAGLGGGGRVDEFFNQG